MNGPAESSPKPGIGYRRPPTPLRTPSFTPRGDVKLQRAVLKLARPRECRVVVVVIVVVVDDSRQKFESIAIIAVIIVRPSFVAHINARRT
jgi:hypothetical protein